MPSIEYLFSNDSLSNEWRETILSWKVNINRSLTAVDLAFMQHKKRKFSEIYLQNKNLAVHLQKFQI